MKKMCLVLSMAMVMSMFGMMTTALAWNVNLPYTQDFEQTNYNLTDSWYNASDQGWTMYLPGGGTIHTVTDGDFPEHGKVMKQSTGGTGSFIRQYFPTQTSGKFLMSFDVKFADLSAFFYVRMNSGDSPGADATHLITMTGGGCDANWGGISFEGDNVFSANRWVRVDIMIDMDNKNIHEYINGGKAYLGKNYSFSMSQMQSIDFQLETAGKTAYYDNFYFRKITGDNIAATFKCNSKIVEFYADAGQQTLELDYPETINPLLFSTNTVTLQSLGTNPIVNNVQNLNISGFNTSNNKAVINLAQPLVDGVRYKLTIDSNLKTIFGQSLSRYEYPFVASATGEVTGTNWTTDFSGLSAINAPAANADISAGAATGWKYYNPTGSVTAITDADLTLANGESGFTDGAGIRATNTGLVRAISPAVKTGKLEVEYRMRPESGNIFFMLGNNTAGDRELNYMSNTNFVFFYQAPAPYSGFWDFAFAPRNLNTWYKVKEVIDIEKKTYDVYLNDVSVFVGAPLPVNKSGSDIITAGGYDYFKLLVPDAGSTYVFDYINVRQSFNAPAISNIMFVDYLGNQTLAYTNSTLSPETNKIAVKFNTAMDYSSLQNSVTLIGQDGEQIVYTDSYDAATNTYTMNLSNFLAQNKRYTLTIPGTVKNSLGVEMFNTVSGDVTTGAGTFKVLDLKIQKNGTNVQFADLHSGDTVAVTATVIHTSGDIRKAVAVYSGYKATKMVSFDFKEITLAENQRNAVITLPITIDDITKIDKIKGFLWDNFETLKPLIVQAQL